MGFYHFPGFLTVNHCGHMPPHGFIDSVHYLVHGFLLLPLVLPDFPGLYTLGALAA